MSLRALLESQGHEVQEEETCEGGERLFRARRPDAVIVDHLLPDGNALKLLPRILEIDPLTPVIIMTGYGSIDLAVQAMKQGAEHFLEKPVEPPVLNLILKKALERQRNRRKEFADKTRAARDDIDPFLGESDAIQRLHADAQRVALVDSPVLILGETGVGKGILAKWLHKNSPRSEEAFVDLNCAGFAREFLESELFGHERGAFTGAVAPKQGLLDVAHRGTAFLDEIGDMDPQIQPKLLKVLEEKRFRRLGDVKDRTVDLRLIAATHQDLSAMVNEKRFRSDLYFRISTIPLSVPPLRGRLADLPILAQRLLEGIASDLGRGEVSLSKDAVQALVSHPWPGNIRELRNVLERAILLTEGRALTRGDLRFDPCPDGIPDDRPEGLLTLGELERQHVERVLKVERWHVERAASRLGIPRSSLYQKIKRLGLKPEPV